MSENKKFIVNIGGPTGVGKTNLSINLAQKYNIPILSTDSRQVFKEMTIGTAKPSQDELNQVKHYFIDSHSIQDPMNAGIYESLAIDLLNNLFRSYTMVIACGGTGFYHEVICEGLDEFPDIPKSIKRELLEEYESKGLKPLLLELKAEDPESHANIDLENPRRVLRALEVIRSSNKAFSSFKNAPKKARSFECIKLYLTEDRQILYDRINERVDQMLADGLEAEARSLYQFKSLKALHTVGYQEFFKYFDGEISKDEAIRLIKRNSRRYAKRQLTWYRNHGWKAFHRKNFDEIVQYIECRLTS